MAVHNYHTTKWRVSLSAHSQELADYIHRMYGVENCLQYVENNSGITGISQKGPTDAHTGIKRTPCASLSVPIESIWSWRRVFPGSHHYEWWKVVSPLWAGVKMAAHGVLTWIPFQRKISRHSPYLVRVMATVFWDSKGVILLHFLKLWPLHDNVD